jgi:hypothetical protein
MAERTKAERSAAAKKGAATRALNQQKTKSQTAGAKGTSKRQTTEAVKGVKSAAKAAGGAAKSAGKAIKSSTAPGRKRKP